MKREFKPQALVQAGAGTHPRESGEASSRPEGPRGNPGTGRVDATIRRQVGLRLGRNRSRA